MTLFVVPYRPFEGAADKNEHILAACEAHPERFTLPLTRDDIRLTVASYLTNPQHLVWEVWNDGTFCGIFMLSRIVPQSDALWHFVFFDGDLMGKRSLLRNFLQDICFGQLGLQRVSVEVPENVQTLIKFVRRYLGFTYEGETALAKSEAARRVSGGATWITRQGSRRERAHLLDSTWHDVLLLRVLKEDIPCP